MRQDCQKGALFIWGNTRLASLPKINLTNAVAVANLHAAAPLADQSKPSLTRKAEKYFFLKKIQTPLLVS